MTEPRGPTSRIELRVVGAYQTATVRETVGRDEITESLGRMYQAVGQALAKQGVAADGSPFARYHEFGDSVDLEAGRRVSTPIRPDGNVKPSELPGGPVAIVVHAGPYERLPATYDAIRNWLERSGRVSRGGPWEIYMTDPSTEPDSSRWLTEVIWPLQPK